MKIKTILLPMFAVLLAGCGGGPAPGHFVKPNTSADYGLSCDAIQGEIHANDTQLRQAQAGGAISGFCSFNKEACSRDIRARNNVLQGLLYQKGCVNPNAAGAGANSGTQQPESKEKSRVIICNDDQTCVVE